MSIESDRTVDHDSIGAVIHHYIHRLCRSSTFCVVILDENPHANIWAKVFTHPLAVINIVSNQKPVEELLTIQDKVWTGKLLLSNHTMSNVFSLVCPNTKMVAQLECDDCVTVLSKHKLEDAHRFFYMLSNCPRLEMKSSIFYPHVQSKLESIASDLADESILFLRFEESQRYAFCYSEDRKLYIQLAYNDQSLARLVSCMTSSEYTVTDTMLPDISTPKLEFDTILKKCTDQGDNEALHRFEYCPPEVDERNVELEIKETSEELNKENVASYGDKWREWIRTRAINSEEIHSAVTKKHRTPKKRKIDLNHNY